MIETHGPTHLSLSVRDPEASLAFYARRLGVRECHRDENGIQVPGPGPHDVIAFERRPPTASGVGSTTSAFASSRPRTSTGRSVRPRRPGRILRRGEFGPGQPFVYVADPDGYEIELRFE